MNIPSSKKLQTSANQASAVRSLWLPDSRKRSPLWAALGVFMSIDQQARKILNELREKVLAGNDGAIYGDKSRALKDIDLLLSSPSTKGVKYLLLPTANLEELSLENGWGKEFQLLANQLEDLLGIS